MVKVQQFVLLLRLFLDRFMEDGSSKDGSGDGGETWGMRVHTRRVYETNESHGGVCNLFGSLKSLNISKRKLIVYYMAARSYPALLKSIQWVVSGQTVSQCPRPVAVSSVFLYKHTETWQKIHWKSCDAEKNLGLKPTNWGGSCISVSILCCQDASAGCKCWHVMQPWTIPALPWCKKKNLHWGSSLAYEWVSTGMYGKLQKIPSEGGEPWNFVYTQQKCCLFGGERASWCVFRTSQKRRKRKFRK